MSRLGFTVLALGASMMAWAACGQNGSSSASGDSSAGDGGITLKRCAWGCETAADCCLQGQTGCPGDKYPNNVTCENHVCRPAQCSSKQDCLSSGTATYDCLFARGMHSCERLCSADVDCAGSTRCIGITSDGVKFCAVEHAGCSNDAECGSSAVCSGGECRCTDDAYCNGRGKCRDGACVCVSDSECVAKFADRCAPATSGSP